ncbi:hypothetical protein [Deinococcus soli (ex Cha et al. 2016)]|uniref:Uncharacterized protein n=2 Tax=Deinococcus soli (ex Cha et al. 2016) TaxID=1309411 RepID=A0AAE3XBV9_9DEIO|nr:hypothetical protein [Deinococcus soli (ex Cha et al. 2016)]MDR6218940.1 hypothetical protein [Deinococcus soli (ex Cha et al. 2016)]MDR6328737.1 hypothetical protein [Deinococcus soli (ex Cha et al. 2016)]MDR6751776.1 hypothetical protein [Deinococcus soli (ex Cha et al. 2016)]
MTTSHRSVTLHRPAGTLSVAAYGATRRVEGRTPDGTRVFSFDISPSLLPDARRVTEQALRGEAGTLHLSGWNVTFASNASTEPGAPRRLSLSVPGTAYPWHLTEGADADGLKEQISGFLNLLS